MDLILVQYYFTGNEHRIIKLPHGNSHSSTPYKRTRPSVMKKMKALYAEKDSVSTMEAIDSEVGDIVGQSSCGSCLRILRQVTNGRRILKLDSGYKAQLAETMEICKTGIGSNGAPFVRCVQAAPEPMCVIASDHQLNEMVRN